MSVQQLGKLFVVSTVWFDLSNWKFIRQKFYLNIIIIWHCREPRWIENECGRSSFVHDIISSPSILYLPRNIKYWTRYNINNDQHHQITIGYTIQLARFSWFINVNLSLIKLTVATFGKKNYSKPLRKFRNIFISCLCSNVMMFNSKNRNFCSCLV